MNLTSDQKGVSSIETGTMEISALVENGYLQLKTVNALIKGGITTLEQLKDSTNEELSFLRGIGDTTLNEIRTMLFLGFGHFLKGEDYEQVEEILTIYLNNLDDDNLLKVDTIRILVEHRLKQNHTIQNLVGIYSHNNSARPLFIEGITTLEELVDYPRNVIQSAIHEDLFIVILQAMEILGLKFVDEEIIEVSKSLVKPIDQLLLDDLILEIDYYSPETLRQEWIRLQKAIKEETDLELKKDMEKREELIMATLAHEG